VLGDTSVPVTEVIAEYRSETPHDTVLAVSFDQEDLDNRFDLVDTIESAFPFRGFYGGAGVGVANYAYFWVEWSAGAMRRNVALPARPGTYGLRCEWARVSVRWFGQATAALPVGTNLAATVRWRAGAEISRSHVSAERFAWLWESVRWLPATAVPNIQQIQWPPGVDRAQIAPSLTVDGWGDPDQPVFTLRNVPSIVDAPGERVVQQSLPELPGTVNLGGNAFLTLTLEKAHPTLSQTVMLGWRVRL